MADESNLPDACPNTPLSDEVSSEIQLRYKLAPTTFKTLLTIPPRPDRRAVLEKVCLATEFRSFPLKQTERAFFREINDHTAIPYLIRGDSSITQPWHKVFLLVQIELLGTGWPSKLSAPARKELLKEKPKMYDLLERVLRCLVDVMGWRMDGRGVTVGLDVLRSVRAGVWEGAGGGAELLQVEGIGPGRREKLVAAGVKSVEQLGGMEFYRIERVLSRNPPFGEMVLRQVRGFPVLKFKMDVLSRCRDILGEGEGGEEGVAGWVVRIKLGYGNEKLPCWNRRHPWTTLVIEGEDGRLVWFWRGSVKRLEGGKELLIRLKANDGEKLKVAFACECIVGTMIRESFRM